MNFFQTLWVRAHCGLLNCRSMAKVKEEIYYEIVLLEHKGQSSLLVIGF